MHKGNIVAHESKKNEALVRERLAKIRFHGINQTQIAKRFGLQHRSSVSKAIHEITNNVNSQKIRKYIDALPFHEGANRR